MLFIKLFVELDPLCPITESKIKVAAPGLGGSLSPPSII